MSLKTIKRLVALVFFIFCISEFPGNFGLVLAPTVICVLKAIRCKNIGYKLAYIFIAILCFSTADVFLDIICKISLGAGALYLAKHPEKIALIHTLEKTE